MIWLQMVLERKRPSGTLVIDYELGQVYNEIGIAYGLQEMWDTAAEHFIKSIDVLKELENYRDTMLGLPAPNLGLVYWIQGRLEESENVLVEILEIQAANFGVDDIESFR
jgi:tetratricopeptide (TPR) repeat protein